MMYQFDSWRRWLFFNFGITHDGSKRTDNPFIQVKRRCKVQWKLISTSWAYHKVPTTCGEHRRDYRFQYGALVTWILVGEGEGRVSSNAALKERVPLIKLSMPRYCSIPGRFVVSEAKIINENFSWTGIHLFL